MADKVQHSGGIGFLGLLQILFIGLKLTGYINWSWWWVMSPFLFGTGLIILIGIVAIIILVKYGK